MMAAMGALPADLAYSQALDADRIARLLDVVGPSVLITHSAAGPVGWLVADARPELVRGIVAVEPLGPLFVDFPGMGALSWGLTAAPITYDPPFSSPEEVAAADASTLRVPALDGIPVQLVTGGASVFADFRQEFADLLTRSGAPTEVCHLPDVGIEGNGHGLIFEANSDRTVEPVLEWLESGPW